MNSLGLLHPSEAGLMPFKISILPFCLALLTAFGCAKKLPEKDDAQSFDGSWRVVEIKGHGKKAQDEFMPRATWVVDKGVVKMMVPEGLAGEFLVRADLAKTPGEIEFVYLAGADTGATELGIVAIEGNKLKLCVADGGKDRPTEFAAKEDPPWTLLVLQRQ